MERSLQAGSLDDDNTGELRRAEKRNRNGKSNRFLECYGFAGDRGVPAFGFPVVKEILTHL